MVWPVAPWAAVTQALSEGGVRVTGRQADPVTLDWAAWGGAATRQKF